jgi:hypothetical protein
MVSVSISAFAATGGTSSGGGHIVTQCNGNTVLLDEYNLEETVIHLSDDLRFKDAAQSMADAISKIKSMHPIFGEALQKTYENMIWLETCHPLAPTNDQDFPANGQALSIDQIAVESPYWGNAKVLISTPELNKIVDSPMSVRFLVFHETLKAFFGQDMDRRILRTMVRALAGTSQDFSIFENAVNSINKNILLGKVEVKIVCENCAEILEKQGGSTSLQRLLVYLNYGNLGEWSIDLKEPSHSFILDRKGASLVSLTTDISTFGVPFPPIEPILAIYSNGHFVEQINMPFGDRTSIVSLVYY